ncbi:hypothetical protein BJF88_10380 [Cellulosimicrobium sp. CUA-896]|nr:hypothetical protein [Cellulosimicrobium sp. CUA-896]OLT54157.1 hypothetical protein BJF88_10380 [Cellulosimicrobium sp. CUA-896]
MTIREFFRTIWAGRYYVLAAVLVVVLGAVLYLARQETLYRATATVQLNGVQSAQGGEELVQVTIDTGADDVTSPEVAEAAAAALGEPDSAAAVADEVDGSFDGESSTMAVEATTTDPERSVEVANAFADAYAARLVAIQAAQVEELDARRQALAEQLRSVRQRLAVDTDDPLALAEQDIIVDDYSALTVEINTLRGIAVPGEVVAPATGAEPLGLSAPTVLALAVLVGLLAGVGLAFGRRGLDVRVRSAAESTHLTDTPVLAELYGARPAEKEFSRTLALPVASKVASPFTESIRELRTAVQVSTAGLKHAVVVVTAADPSAPRAFITANLAASFALSGRRTVAISGDLRRPQLDTLLPPTESWQGDEHELRPTTVPNLRVMPVPEEEMDPADFLATARARQLVRSLRDHAEVVVIDAPPVLAAADATILGGYSNGVVLIASAGRTDRAVLVAATDRLRVSNVPLLGVALTGVKGDRRMTYASTYGDGHVAPEDAEHAGAVEQGTEPQGAGPQDAGPQDGGEQRRGAGHRAAEDERGDTPDARARPPRGGGPTPVRRTGRTQAARRAPRRRAGRPRRRAVRPPGARASPRRPSPSSARRRRTAPRTRVARCSRRAGARSSRPRRTRTTPSTRSRPASGRSAGERADEPPAARPRARPHGRPGWCGARAGARVRGPRRRCRGARRAVRRRALRERLEGVGVRVDVLPLPGAVAGADRRRAGRLSPWTLVAAARTVPFLVRLSRHVRRLRPDVVHTTSLKADLLGVVPPGPPGARSSGTCTTASRRTTCPGSSSASCAPSRGWRRPRSWPTPGRRRPRSRCGPASRTRGSRPSRPRTCRPPSRTAVCRTAVRRTATGPAPVRRSWSWWAGSARRRGSSRSCGRCRPCARRSRARGCGSSGSPRSARRTTRDACARR